MKEAGSKCLEGLCGSQGEVEELRLADGILLSCREEHLGSILKGLLLGCRFELKVSRLNEFHELEGACCLNRMRECAWRS